MGLMGQFTEDTAFCYVFITLQLLTLHFHDAGVWLLMLLYLAMVLIIFGLKKVMGEFQQKWQKKGPPQILPYLRAMKKLAKFFRIYFFRILEINESFAVTWGLFIQEKWLNLS